MLTGTGRMRAMIHRNYLQKLLHQHTGQAVQSEAEARQAILDRIPVVDPAHVKKVVKEVLGGRVNGTSHT